MQTNHRTLGGNGSQKRGKKLRRVAVGLLCVGSGLAGSLGLAAAADASTILGGTPVMSAPTTNSYWYGSAPWTEYASMDCWTDSWSWSYGTNRWFRVSAWIWNPRTGRMQPGYGFASANRITNQIGVGHCP
jgi:hypothetical protein